MYFYFFYIWSLVIYDLYVSHKGQVTTLKKLWNQLH